MKTSVDNYIFWTEIGSGYEEPGGTPPPRVPRSAPRGFLNISDRILAIPFSSDKALQIGRS